MEYKSPWMALPVLLIALLWCLNTWQLVGRYHLTVAAAELRRTVWQNALRPLLFLAGLCGWGFLAYSLAQPRTPNSYSSASREVNDIMLVVDVSRSMLAVDLEPNRLEVTKRQIREFARRRVTDRVGVILFSESVFTLLPLSTDPGLLDSVVADINIGYLGSGTNIGDGLALGVARLMESETKNKVIVLLTDGVANVGLMTPLQAAEEAKKQKIKVYTIGVGTQGEAKIPVGNTFGTTSYQLIPGGSIDYETLKVISDMTGAKFYPATDEKALSKVFSEIDALERTEIKVDNQVVYSEHYYRYFVIALLLLLLSEFGRRLLLREVL